MLTSLHEINHKRRLALASQLGIAPEDFVTGEGNTLRPQLMLIGEAPGAREVVDGRPFVGQAGRNLQTFLNTLGVERSSIYLTNAVKIRRVRLSATGRLCNRPPTKAEVEAFLPWLYDEIALVQPSLLVTLGNTPLLAVLGKQGLVGMLHGRVQTTSFGIPLFPLYHPAAVIYNRALLSTYETDLALLRDYLDCGA